MYYRLIDFILLYMHEEVKKKRRVYGIASLIIPGLGQILSGRALKGVLQFTFFLLFIFVMKTVWNGFNWAFFVYLLGLISYWLYVAVDAYVLYDKRTAPCEKACPVGLDIPGYIDLAIRGEFNKAKSLIYHRSPFIGTLSYICHEPCKRWCARRKVDAPLEIRAIKRYVYENAKKFEFNFKRRFSERIGVVGAGPSGLTCAFFLARVGYEVDVFDAGGEPGGMLRAFIPSYRLPDRVLKSDIDEILSTDLINLKTGVVLGKDIFIDDLREKYDAIYIATGAWNKRTLGIDGEEKNGVIHALDFLREVKRGHIKKIYGTIVVVGGGDVAVDAARSAMRLSVHRKVIIAYRRSKREMRIDEVELSEIEGEGIRIMENVVPVQIKGKDWVEGIVFKKTKVDNQNVVMLDESFEIKASYVIVAIGQSVHKVSNDLEQDEYGRIMVDKNMMTSKGRVFAGGDVVRGPSTIVLSIRDGREAARNIHKMLHPLQYMLEDFMYFVPIHEKPKALLQVKKPSGRHVLPLKRPYNERIMNFEPVEVCFDEESVLEEGIRCLACPYRYT